MFLKQGGVYPLIFAEMERQNISGAEMLRKAGLCYQTTFPKLKRGYGGKISLDEAAAIRRALGLHDKDLEELFIKAG